MDPRFKFETRLLAAFAAAVLVIAALAGISWNASREILQAAQWVTHSRDSLDHLAARDAAIAAREISLRRVKELTTDSPREQEQWALLRATVDERLAISGRVELLRRTEGAAAANAFVMIRRQLAARARAAAALRESEESLVTTLHSIGDAVLATDTDGRITRMNPVAERLTGWLLAEARGRPVDEVFRIIHEQTRAPAEVPVAKVLASGQVQGLANHTLLIARDGTECPIADSAAPIRDAAGRVPARLIALPPGEGSRFCVWLPWREFAAAGAPAGAPVAA